MTLPEKISFLCPHCNIRSLLVLRSSSMEYNDSISVKGKDGKMHETSVKMEHKIYRCVYCTKDTYILFRGPTQVISVNDSTKEAEVVGDLPPEITHQYPIPTPSAHQAVPDNIKNSSIEAEKCFSVSAYNACGVMARRAIDCLCVDKEAKGENLYAKLEFLKNNNLITPDLWEWAEELRIVGRYCLSCQGLIFWVEGSAFDEHGPDNVEQFSHTGYQSNFLGFAFFQQSLIESFEQRVELHRHQGGHVQCSSESGISLFGQVAFAPY